MAPIILSCIVFACIAGGTLLGIFLRSKLPEHHLSGDTKDVVRLSTGLVGTMAALVLGLLIASANSTYDTQSAQINDLTAKVILLDNILAQYGEETKATRVQLRRAVATSADQSGTRTFPVPPSRLHSLRAPHPKRLMRGFFNSPRTTTANGL